MIFFQAVAHISELDMIEERVELLFEPYYQITEIESPKNFPVVEPFTRSGKAAVDSYFGIIAKTVYARLGMMEGNLAECFCTL